MELMTKIIGKYKNGNYMVTICSDGTKIRENMLDNLTPDVPESMDIKITNKCDLNCMMCHEDSCSNGKHGDIMGAKFIKTLGAYKEIALGGGNPLSHPDLEKFLIMCKALYLLPSITVNQTHFIRSYDYIKRLVDNKLIYGVGISIHDNITPELIGKIKTIPNAVIHVINGVINMTDLNKLSSQGLKLLILGYKNFRRGEKYQEGNGRHIQSNQHYMFKLLPHIIKCFKVVSFDNLAIEQLEVKRLMNNEEWSEFFMGNDAQYTMYIDLVENKFAGSSTHIKRYDLKDDIKEMFEVVRNENS